jgi:[protein-PII] uridylyltransferase
LLEPDIKEGAGGQRDHDEMVWLAAIESGQPATSVRPLVRAGLIEGPQAQSLERAYDVLAEARWRLHGTDTRPPGFMSLDAAYAAGVDAEAVQAALAAAHHTLLEVRARMEGRLDAGVSWTPATLLERLDAGPDALEGLEHAAWQGDLERLLPGLSDRMTLRRPGLSHRYTVGDHSLRAALILAEVEGDEFAAQVLSTVPDRAPLQVATLTHDFGKDEPGPGHEERGASVAERVAMVFGLSRPLAWGVATLVREHLLLTETAAHQDLADEDVILRAAARLGDRSLVGPLYLLTRADMLATGPEAWTPWRAARLRELTSKLDAALSEQVDGAGIIAAADEVREKALRQASAAGMERSVLGFLEEAPLRYLASRQPEEVLRHARLVRESRGPLGQGVVVDATSGETDGTWNVTVVARDREGLFGLIAGAISLADLDILGAEAFTETSGVVLDVFTVRSATLADVEPERWRRLEQLLRDMLRGSVDLGERLHERRRYHPAPDAGEVEVDIDTSSVLATIVRVRTPDRIGLLHDLAAALHDTGFDIRFATAESRRGRVSDVFHVVDAQGEPPRSDEALARLGAGIRAAAQPEV